MTPLQVWCVCQVPDQSQDCAQTSPLRGISWAFMSVLWPGITNSFFYAKGIIKIVVIFTTLQVVKWVKSQLEPQFQISSFTSILLCFVKWNMQLFTDPVPYLWFNLTASGDHRILPAFILLQTASGKLPHHYSAAGLSTQWVCWLKPEPLQIFYKVKLLLPKILTSCD